MNLAVVNEATEAMNVAGHTFSEEEKNFVVRFAFKSESKEKTLALIDRIVHSADAGESRKIMEEHQSKLRMKPAWAEQAENLLIALEMYRIEEEKAVNRLADILNAGGIDMSAEQIRSMDTEELKSRVKEKAEVR